MICFGRVLWHINHCRLFNGKSSLYIYIKYTWFVLVGFYGISTIVGYLMPNPLNTYIYKIYMICFGRVLWHINHFWLICHRTQSKYLTFLLSFMMYSQIPPKMYENRVERWQTDSISVNFNQPEKSEIFWLPSWYLLMTEPSWHTTTKILFTQPLW